MPRSSRSPIRMPPSRRSRPRAGGSPVFWSTIISIAATASPRSATNRSSRHRCGPCSANGAPSRWWPRNSGSPVAVVSRVGDDFQGAIRLGDGLRDKRELIFGEVVIGFALLLLALLPPHLDDADL